MALHEPVLFILVQELEFHDPGVLLGVEAKTGDLVHIVDFEVLEALFFVLLLNFVKGGKEIDPEERDTAGFEVLDHHSTETVSRIEHFVVNKNEIFEGLVKELEQLLDLILVNVS